MLGLQENKENDLRTGDRPPLCQRRLLCYNRKKMGKGAKAMSDPWQEKGSSGVEEFRQIQCLARTGQMEEAQERALQLLETPRLSRKLEAKVHHLICRLYIEGFSRPGLSAALHGEEAVRLADLLHDPWLKCEALTTLIRAYCRLGDFVRAEAACAEVEAAADRNPGVVSGGPAAAWALRAEVLLAQQDLEGASAALVRAEATARQVVGGARVVPDLRALQVELLLLRNQREGARHLLTTDTLSDDLRTDWQRAWLAVLEMPEPGAALAALALLERAQAEGNEGGIAQALALRALVDAHQGREGAPATARLALNRAMDAGRVDLAGQIRRQLSDMLD